MVIQKCRTDAVYAPFLTVDQQIVLSVGSQNDLVVSEVTVA